ncbi:HalOD1 output domain-containing protein [Halomarina rubra]|uniref:HalOD1 output domain-containing protein n=1 Tax=Halomarina rubra TaxID=2071873 RepID=A0ABD6ASQ0_9EURY|nr:HalOD1 output domain-containing protein [Halomarina rubra]
MSQGTGRLPPSVAVIEQVATEEDVDPMQLEPPLNDVIDPDALDALCAGESMNGFIVFSYCGYTVTVDATGGVTVEERPFDASVDTPQPTTAISD